jgi:hypothetical protein
MPSCSPTVQRRCAACEEVRAHDTTPVKERVSGGPSVHRREGSTTAPHVTHSVSADVRALQGRGSPLPAETRAFFETRFGANFSQVRVHTDTHAARTASSINAKAFTVGRDIAFGAGQFSPDSQTGRRLLAHELTHVVQQGAAPDLMRLDSPAAVLQMQTLVGNRVLARLIENRMPQPGGGLAGGGAPPRPALPARWRRLRPRPPPRLRVRVAGRPPRRALLRERPEERPLRRRPGRPLAQSRHPPFRQSSPPRPREPPRVRLEPRRPPRRRPRCPKTSPERDERPCRRQCAGSTLSQSTWRRP